MAQFYSCYKCINIPLLEVAKFTFMQCTYRRKNLDGLVYMAHIRQHILFFKINFILNSSTIAKVIEQTKNYTFISNIP